MSDQLDVGLRERLRSRNVEGLGMDSGIDQTEQTPTKKPIPRSAVLEIDYSSDEDDSLLLIPDTPSPVFSKKSSRNISRNSRIKNQNGSSPDQPASDSRSKALDQLVARRMKLKQKTTGGGTEQDGRNDGGETSQSPGGASNQNFAEPCLESDSDEEFLRLVCGANGISDTVSPPSISHDAPDSDSDSTDIDEDDFEEFIRNLRSSQEGAGRPHVSPDKGETSERSPDNGGSESVSHADASKRKPSPSSLTHSNGARKRTRSMADEGQSDLQNLDMDASAGTSRGDQEGDDRSGEASREVSAGSTEPSLSSGSTEPPRSCLFDFSRVKRGSRPSASSANISESLADGTSTIQAGSSQSAAQYADQSASTSGTSRSAATSAENGATFSVPENVSPRRNGRTMTQTRVPGLRRRGNRTSWPSGSAAMSASLLVSPASAANHQMAEDEAMARRLQEELDREFAATLENAMTPSTSTPGLGGRMFPTARQRLSGSGLGRNAGRLAAARRQIEESLDSEVQMYLMLGQMSDDEWEAHQRTMSSYDTSNLPPSEASTSLDPQGHRRNRSVNERSPVRPTTRRPGVTTRSSTTTSRTPTNGGGSRRRQRRADWEYGNSLLGMSWEQEGSSLGQDNDSSLMDFSDVLDQEIFNRLSSDFGLRVAGRGRQRGRNSRRVPRDPLLNSFSENDYEALLNLAEQIGDAKPRGLTSQQINLLPTKSYKATEVGEEEMKECSICFVEYTDGNKLRLMQCFHYFHAECIDRWLKENSSCPICRVAVKFD